eukprot:jgi/Mesvir1/14190/Mv09647-RA.1
MHIWRLLDFLKRRKRNNGGARSKRSEGCCTDTARGEVQSVSVPAAVACVDNGMEDFTELPHLPDDVWLRVFEFLSHQELGITATTCKRFSELARQPCVWKQILSRWNPAPGELHFAEGCLAKLPRLIRAGCLVEAGAPPVDTAWEDLDKPWMANLSGPVLRDIFLRICYKPHSLIVDAGTGYCKFGWSDEPPPTTAAFVLGHVMAGDLHSLRLVYWHLSRLLKAHPQEQAILCTDIVPSTKHGKGEAARAARREARASMCKMLFENLQVPAVCIMDQCVLSLFATRRTSGLVINIGMGASTVTPVWQGRPLREHAAVSGAGAMMVSLHLSRMMATAGYAGISMATIKLIKEQLCAVSPEDLRQLSHHQARMEQATVHVENEGSFTLYKERLLGPEVLFSPAMFGYEDFEGIQVAASQAILSCHAAAVVKQAAASQNAPPGGGVAAEGSRPGFPGTAGEGHFAGDPFWFMDVLVTGGSASFPVSYAAAPQYVLLLPSE